MENVTSPFHAGEQSVQSRLGVRETIEPWARRVVRPFLPDQHRELYTRLPFAVAAARDKAGRPWATLLAGPQGFVQSPDDKSLCLAATSLPGDALEGALTAGAEFGLHPGSLMCLIAQCQSQLVQRRQLTQGGRLYDSHSA